MNRLLDALLDALDALRAACPVVVMTRKRLEGLARNAFELGQDSTLGGRPRVTPKPRHLHAV